MKDEHDDEILDWVPPLDFEESDWEDADATPCPCCRVNNMSEIQERCQIEGEICTVCNFYEWEEL